MPRKFTHEEFLHKLKENNSHYREGKFEVLGKYERRASKILLKCGEFLHYIEARSLLKHNACPDMWTAVDKLSYFKEELRRTNIHYRRGEFEILGWCAGKKKHVTVRDDLGEYIISIYNLRRGSKPGIKNSVDKNLHCVNRARKLRDDFEITDYSKLEYVSARENLTFVCKKHNYEYTQRLDHHLSNVQGCIHCMEGTIRYDEHNIDKHEHFLTSLKGYLYVFKLSNDKESFFKVGITGENRIDTRVRSLRSDYDVDVIYKEFNDMVTNYRLEQRFLREFKDYKYTPRKFFRGYTECLTTNPVEEYYNWFNKMSYE